MLSDKVIDGVHLEVDDNALAAGLLVAFSGRHGGISEGPYESLNLSGSVGDDPAAVELNRMRVAKALDVGADRLVFAHQVHGADAIEANPGDSGVLGACDVLVARAAGPILTILTADCVPVVMQGDRGVTIVHAGWRGLVSGAIAAAAERVGRVRKAWVGPSIHACCYEVGPEVVDAFRAAELPVAAADRVDPGRAALVALRREGVDDMDVVDTCTSCDPGYFSYRRDGVTGRQGAFAGLVA